MAKLTDYGLTPLDKYKDIDCSQVKYRRGHRYVVTGIEEKLISVTTYLGILSKPYLVPWARKQAADRFQDKMLEGISMLSPSEGFDKETFETFIAMSYEYSKKDDKTAMHDGAATHQLIENALMDTEHEVDPDVQERVMPSVQGAMKAIDDLQLETIGLEIPIWHPNYKYAGTIDFLGRDGEGEPVILDFKRANRLSDEYAYQIGAYVIALNCIIGDEPGHTRGYVVRLPNKLNEDIEIKEVDCGAAFEIFKACKSLHELHQSKEISPWMKYLSPYE